MIKFKNKLLSILIFLVTTTFYGQVADNVPTDGLVAYYSFSGNANDESGNGHNGIVNGATLTTDRFGNLDSAYNFFLENDYISLDENLVFTDADGFTVSIWMKKEDFTGYLQGYLFDISDGLSQNQWQQRIGIQIGDPEDNSQKMINFYGEGLEGLSWMCKTTNVDEFENQWINIIGVVDMSSNLVKLYINGTELANSLTSEGYDSISLGQGNSNSKILGGRSTLNPIINRFYGEMDDLAIWNRALTQEEITTINSNCILPAAPTGDAEQTFCNSPTVADLVATGDNIQWYDAATDGNLLDNTTALIDGQIVYASQTINDCESTERLEVSVTIQDLQITASATEICAGESVDLSISSGLATSGTACISTELPTNLQNGLVGYWPFCGNANDESGNGNNGSVNGATLTADRFGNADSAYNFDGTSNYIESNRTHLNTFTASVWIKLSTSNCFSAILDAYPSSWEFLSDCMSGTNLSTAIWNNPTTYEIYQSNYIIPQNVWINVVMSYSNNTLNIYSEGNLVFTGTTIAPPTLNGLLYFGRSRSGADSFFKGDLDDVAIWDRALAPSEIQPLANASTYTWSTGDTTATISVTPTETTDYWVDITTNGITCRENITINVTTPEAPTGDTEQTFCNAPTIADLVATGDYIQWYDAATDGNLLDNTTALIDGQIVYASQTINDCESTERLEVSVTIQDIQITASATEVCAGESVDLSINPDLSTSGTACTSTELPTNLQNGLVGYWPFCGNANDESGNGNNGSVNGATLTADRFGNADSAYNFEENDSYIQIDGNNLPQFSNKFSYAVQFKVNEITSGTDCTPSSNIILNNEGLYELGIDCNGLLSYAIANEDPSWTWVAITQVSLNQWYEFIFIYNEGEINIYLDGNLFYNYSGFGSLVDFHPDLNDLRFGNRQLNDVSNIETTSSFNGKIDEIAIWNRALAPSEIQQLANASTYTWSTGDTTATISVTPTETADYWVDITTNGITCREHITINITTPEAPAGDTAQTFCNAPTVADLVATGDNIQWYDAATGGNVLEATTALIDGQIVYASQTINDCESTERLEVSVTIQDIQITASTTEVCAGEGVDLNVIGDVNSTYLWSTGESNFSGQGPLVDEYSLVANTVSQNTFSIIPGNIYRLEVSGTISLGGGAGNQRDVAYYIQSGSDGAIEGNPFDSACNLKIWTSLFCDIPGLRPSPDIYDPSTHTYNYPFTANSSTLDVGFWDSPLGDNGPNVVTFKLYELSNSESTITVYPTETTEYWVDITTNGITCRENITINVTTPEAPAGDTEQTFCNTPTVADLVATGDNMQWYDAATDGNLLDNTTALIDGQIVYASQTINDCESTERLEVTVTVQDIQITASATEICAGESVTLSLDYQPPTICDMDITLTDIPLGEDIPGFTYGGFFNNHHYYVYDSPTTWTEGEQIARANGGYLVCINDESENTFVSNLTNNNIWIGLFRDAETCEFRWLDCIDIAYTNWRPGEPNSGPCGEPYAQIIRGCSFGFNTWNNLGNNASNGSCYSNMVPIMEIDPTIYESHNLATASFLWSTGDTTETISVTPTATTDYWLDVTTNGVTCRENITVTVNEVPLAPVSGGDIVSCAANSLDTITAQASVNVNESVVWYNAATAGNIVTTPNWSEVGSITYYAEAVNTITGCTSETRTPVTLTIQAAPSAPNSAGNVEVCEVSPFNPLTATAIATPNQVIIWYDALEDGNIIDNPVLNTTGTITYYAEAQNVITGCLSITRTPVTLTINTAPNAPVSNGNITECELNPLQTLTAAAFVEANQSITWYNNAVDGIVVENPSLSNTGVITYYAEAVDNDSGCTSLTRTPVTLTITNTPEPPEGQSIQEFCYAAQISDLLVTGENLAFYTSEFSTENLPLDLNLNDGDRIYVSQSVNNCESLTRLEINIILHEIPDPINTNTTLEYCLGANTTLADLEINEQGFDLEWYNAATGFTAYEPNTILENGVTYYATLYDPVTGCESLNRLAITPLIRPCNIKIYNALSLNEDGKNDYMVIENVQFYPINTLEVYNRNGQLVFKTTAYGQNNANYFYGKANVSGIVGDGNKLPTGSYMYVFKYFDAFNTQEHKSLKGFLTINSN